MIGVKGFQPGNLVGKTHGMNGHPAHTAWDNMKSRCNNPSHPRFHLWGGRGITYDTRWEDFSVFWEDMKATWKEGLTLDREDNDGPYCKANCRWVTQKVQQNNRRNNRKVGLH
jgi:hypothetical protein